MNQSNLSKWLKFISVAVGLMGLLVFFYIVPMWGQELAVANPELAFSFWPWLIFIWLMAIPCYLSLIIFWGICKRIQEDNSFSKENARALGLISKLAISDSILCFLGNFALLYFKMSHPGVLLLFLFVVFGGIAVAIVSAALAHLVEKASKMKEENDLTI